MYIYIELNSRASIKYCDLYRKVYIYICNMYIYLCIHICFYMNTSWIKNILCNSFYTQNIKIVFPVFSCCFFRYTDVEDDFTPSITTSPQSTSL